MRRFIAEGVLVLPVTDRPQELHRLIHSKGEALNDGGENPGDGIFDAVPELSELLAAPSVRGALTSLLGEGWSCSVCWGVPSGTRGARGSTRKRL